MKKVLIYIGLFLIVLTGLRPDLVNSANPSWIEVDRYSGASRTIDLHSKHMVWSVGRTDVYEVTEKWVDYSRNYWETYPIQIDCKLRLFRVVPNAEHRTSEGLKSTKLWASGAWAPIQKGSQDEAKLTIICN